MRGRRELTEDAVVAVGAGLEAGLADREAGDLLDPGAEGGLLVLGELVRVRVLAPILVQALALERERGADPRLLRMDRTARASQRQLYEARIRG